VIYLTAQDAVVLERLLTLARHTYPCPTLVALSASAGGTNVLIKAVLHFN